MVALAGPAATADACPARRPIPIVMVPLLAEPTIDKTQDLAALRQAARRNGAPHASMGRPLGLTISQFLTRFEHRIEYVAGPGPEVCGLPTEVRVEFGVAHISVLVASEAAQSRCLTEEVLEHEQRHVAVDRGIVGAYLPRVETRLREAVDRIGPIRRRSVDEIQAAITRQLQPILDDELNAMRRDAELRQIAIDTPEEYARISHACSGLGGRLLSDR